jgi:hypothetical protein
MFYSVDKQCNMVLLIICLSDNKIEVIFVTKPVKFLWFSMNVICIFCDISGVTVEAKNKLKLQFKFLTFVLNLAKF